MTSHLCSLSVLPPGGICLHYSFDRKLFKESAWKVRNFYLGPTSKPISLSEYLSRWKSWHYICHEILPVRSRYWNEMRSLGSYIAASSCLLLSWFIYRFFLCGKEIKFCSVSHTLWSYKLSFVVFRHTPNQTVFQKIL